ncbi:MAG TPA: hypothetical protein VFE58_13500, partial [Tepidisphaeraceae bacterium]|nr:hypothetical protein [Tepidisphaeraceae bacterium]
ISDGLSRDLGHICEQSGVGAIIEADAIPIHDDAIELFRRDRVSPLEHALHDGEDHELLFTCASADLSTANAYRIGVITEGREVLIRQNGIVGPLARKGWEHSL